MADNDKKLCIKCKKMKKLSEFYCKKNGEPVELCKDCLTLHIDNFDESTFVWILEKLDVPYIPNEWNNLRDKAYQRMGRKMTGKSVLGRYLSKMHLKQWKDYSWKDTEELQNKEKKDAEEALENNPELKALLDEAKEKYEAGEISEAEYRTFMDTGSQKEQDEKSGYTAGEANAMTPGMDFYNENKFISDEDMPHPEDELTKEDKIYLAMKWGRFYQPDELISLERQYNDMKESFDVSDPDTENSLILLCKTTLKMNQNLDAGDYDGYQKLSKVADSLRKSANFTAAQNKEKKDEFLNCIGDLVTFCEKEEGFIPEFKIDVPYDIVDEIIQDQKDYTRSLIYEDKSLARLIEDHLKDMKNLEQQKQDRAEARAKGLDEVELDDEDYEDYWDSIEEDKAADEAFIKEEARESDDE